MKRFIIAALLFALPCLHHAAAAEAKPNIVFMVADDLGYRDLGCYGATKKPENFHASAASISPASPP